MSGSTGAAKGSINAFLETGLEGKKSTTKEQAHLIALSTPGSGLSRELLKAQGGFLWWYADLVDEKGDGLVIIWSFGLPFLPGYASAARQDKAPEAGLRPSLNVSTYKEGKLDFYLLQEFEPQDVEWQALEEGDRWVFGKSRLESLMTDQGRRLWIELHLDVPGMPGEEIKITLQAQGAGAFETSGEHRPSERLSDPLPEHDWTPVLCATKGEAVLEFPQSRQELRGRLYHDRNGGIKPLHDLGIDIWVWGRVALQDRDFIYYVLDGQDGSQKALFLEIDTQGKMVEVKDAELRRGPRKRNFGGLRYWPSMEIWRGGELYLQLHHDDVVDSGPFYMRTVFQALDGEGKAHRGIAEICDPERVDLAIHRPLVKMRVHFRERPSSMWLPLFTGPRSGRVSRLLRSWIPGRIE